MRVVFVSWRDLSHPQAGGSEYVVDRLARGLTARHHDVALLAGGPVAARDYEVIGTGGRFGQYARAPLAYLRRFRDVDVVVDVENGIPFFAPLWRRGPVVCLVHHVHSEQWRMYFPPVVARVGYLLEHRVMPRVYRRCCFVAVSPSTATELARLGVDRQHVHTVVMGTDQLDRPLTKAREPTFLVLGRLVPHKRVDVLLRIWEAVRPRTGGTLVIAGDGPERDRLEELAGEQVVFTGFVSEAHKRTLLAQAWVLVHSALHEGWGTVIMEAAAVATPTVAFDVLGVRDSVYDGKTGMLVRTEEEFAAAWVEVASDPSRRARLGDAAREWALSQDWDHAVDEFESILVHACARSKQVRSRSRR